LGENIACNFLEKHNFRIVDRNIRVNNNEIDIIALDQNNDELVFIEVKTRKSYDFGTPALAVSEWKLKNMAFVAREYLRKKHCYLDYRFDIIAIHYLKGKGSEHVGSSESTGKSLKSPGQPQIEHFENISWP